MLVEDNKINQEVALEFLKLGDFKVDVAENGAEAVALVANQAFDCVLMDLQMPVMDGLDATRAIRSLPGSMSNVPIIAVTANVMEEDREVCVAAGMTDFVTKPVDPENVYSAVERLTRHLSVHRASA